MDFKQRYLFSEQWSQLPARRPGWSGQDALETRPGPGGGHRESLLASFRDYICDAHQVTFSQLSVDGDEGYPGDVVYNVTYSLSSQGGLGIK